MPIIVPPDGYRHRPKFGGVTVAVKVAARLHVGGVVDGGHVPTLPVVPILRATGCKQFCSVQRGGKSVKIGLILTTDNGVFIDFFHSFNLSGPVSWAYHRIIYSF